MKNKDIVLVSLCVRVKQDLRDQLKIMAIQEGMSFQEFMIDVINYYLSKEVDEHDK